MQTIYKTYKKCQVRLAHCQRLADQAWRRLCPPLCPLCRLPTTTPESMCAACQGLLPVIDSMRCPGCAAPTAFPQRLCGACLRTPPPFDKLVVAYRYAPPIDQLVCALKFSGRLSYAPILGSLLLQQFSRHKIEKPDCLLPVPLHNSRLRLRGFNQALEIARPLARYYGLPIVHNCIKRVKAGKPQVSLSGRLRRKNMHGAFFAQQQLGRKHVAIVDDVITTATTVAELARIVRRAGAERISVWALARAD